MSSVLTVDLNRDHPHQIEVVSAVSMSGPFTIELRNHGNSLHVHLELDDALAERLTLPASKFHVGADGRETIHVAVDEHADPVTGRLTIVTGYGNETQYVSVTVTPPVEEPSSVEIDAALGTPQRRPDDAPGGSGNWWNVTNTVPVSVLVVAGVAVGVGMIAALITGSPAVFLAVGGLVGVVLVVLRLLYY